MYNIHLLPASFGDSILIEYGNEKKLHYILIDGGPFYAFTDIVKSIRKIAPKLDTLELLIVSHIDIDHIDGIVKMLNQEPLPFKIKDIWFNGLEELEKADDSDLLGGIQGEFLTALIDKLDIPHNIHKDLGGKSICIGEKLRTLETEGGMKLKMLTPTLKDLEKLEKAWLKELKEKKVNQEDVEAILEKLNGDYRYKDEEDSDLLGDDDVDAWAEMEAKEDKSVANASSISFIAEYDNKTCLFAGDTPSKNLLSALEKFELIDEFSNLSVNAWKLSHHGSKKSNQDYLMKKIDAKHILVPSDGKRYHHPDPETISKLLKINDSTLHFYFNYHSDYSDRWENEDWKEKYNYVTYFPDGDNLFTTIKL